MKAIALIAVLFFAGISAAQDVWKITSRGGQKREARNASSLWVVNSTAAPTACPCGKDCPCTGDQCSTGNCATKTAPQTMPDAPVYSGAVTAASSYQGSCSNGSCGNSTSGGIFRSRRGR